MLFRQLRKGNQMKTDNVDLTLLFAREMVGASWLLQNN